MKSLKRTLWLAVGLLSTVLGFIGAFLPLLPTTPFMLLAVFCFARSSERLHDWLVNHPQFGGPIRDWNQRGVIAPRVKWIAVGSMLAVLGISFAFGVPTHVIIIQVVTLGAVATFLLTRPSH
ncbi:YbaN family protein [Maritalea porphyrae]|uniref:YbaN family protein n=1 Tax=Maritalea porphyrae TaxID=880732 RepID=UPI0022AE59ED|nr:YbaN family protein [Maritalea porphyrae]MCZ4271625.1 YbaN family protein [Maritalea porphyrae]